MSRSDRIDRALTSLKEITAQHQAFVEQFSSPQNTRVGSITSSNGTLDLVCFDTKVICVAKPVIAADETAAYEYQFSAQLPDCNVQLVNVYLTQDGHINSPLMQSIHVCDFNNQYIADRLSELVANAMLNSAIFSPKV